MIVVEKRGSAVAIGTVSTSAVVPAKVDDFFDNSFGVQKRSG